MAPVQSTPAKLLQVIALLEPAPLNLALETIDVWSFTDEFTPPALFRSLRHLLKPGDIIAVGAYCPSERLIATMESLGATHDDADQVYSVTFSVNRAEHPNGRSFEVSASETLLAALEAEASMTDGQTDKALFFDHLVCYRRGKPAVPLVCFHDAFSGGDLHVSGHYAEPIIGAFAAGLPSSYARTRNPADYLRSNECPKRSGRARF